MPGALLKLTRVRLLHHDIWRTLHYQHINVCEPNWTGHLPAIYLAVPTSPIVAPEWSDSHWLRCKLWYGRRSVAEGPTSSSSRSFPCTRQQNAWRTQPTIIPETPPAVLDDSDDFTYNWINQDTLYTIIVAYCITWMRMLEFLVRTELQNHTARLHAKAPHGYASTSREYIYRCQARSSVCMSGTSLISSPLAPCVRFRIAHPHQRRYAYVDLKPVSFAGLLLIKLSAAHAAYVPMFEDPQDDFSRPYPLDY